MTNEVSIMGANSIAENYGIFTEYVLFNQSNPVVLQFKELDFSTLDKFLQAFYEVGEQPDILNISYEQANKDLASLKAALRSYGLFPSKIDSTKTLALRCDAESRDRSQDNAFLLKFSGRISLESDLNIEDTSVLFDGPLFTNSQLRNINIKSTTDSCNTMVYLRDANASLLHLDSIMSLWISGKTTLDSLRFTSSEESSCETICDINIAPSSVITVKKSLEIENVNCINLGGILKADKDISIKFANRYGELGLKPKAELIAPSGVITIKEAPNMTVINNGLMGAKKLYLHYGAGALHNNGTIFTKESGKISGAKLFNHKAGQIFARQLKVNTIGAFYNVGNITIVEFTLAASSSKLGGGIIYNNGNITTRKFDTRGKTHFLNNKNGTICAESELNCQLLEDWHNIDHSKGIVNLGGRIKAQSGNIDLNFVWNQYGQFVVGMKLTGVLKAMYCIGGECNFGSNFANPLQLSTTANAQTVVRLYGSQSIEFIHIRDPSNSASKELLPANSANILVTELPHAKEPGFTQLIGDFVVGNVLLEDGRIIFGDDVLKISSAEGGDAAGNNISINAIVMSKGSILMTGKAGQVFVSNMDNSGGEILSFGNLTIDNWNMRGNITLSGNINGPAITEPVNLVLNNTRLAINGDMFNRGLITVIEDSMIICDAFVQGGIINGTAGLKIKASEFVMRATLDMVTKFVGCHEFTESQVANRPKVDLEGIFELDIDELVSIEGSSITADKIKIKSSNKVIIMPTPLYKKIHAHWGSGHRTEETIKLLVSELTGENGIEIFSDGGIMLYSGKYKSNLPIILNAGEIVSIEGVAEGNRVDYYNSWLKERWFTTKTYSESIRESHFYPNLPEFSASLQINAGQGLSIIGVRVEGKGQTEFLIGKEGMSSLASMAPMMEIHLYDRHFTSKRTFLGFIPLGRKRDARYQSSQIPCLNLIESTEGIKAYIYGSFVQVGTTMEGNQIIIEATESISLSTAFEIKSTHHVHESISFGDLKCEFNLKEFSLGIGGTYKRIVENNMVITPVETVYQGNLHLIAPQVNTMGINGRGGIFVVEAKTWNDSPAEARFTSDFSIIEGSATLKLGIKLGAGNFMNSVRDALNGARDGSPEGLVNAGFATYAAYLAGVEILAGSFPKGGAWVELSASMTKQGRHGIRVVPSRFKYGTVIAELDEGNLMATQIDAYNAYIQAKKELKLSSAKNTDSVNQNHAAVEINIPLTTGAPAGINLFGGKSEHYAERHLHFVLKVQNELKLSVLGKASIVGATISAKSLDASFGQLLLESVKDLIKRESFGAHLGLTLDSLSGIGADYSNGLSEMVSKITSIIGTENIKLVVANALHLNGAMIANAQTDENGNLTDLGNLEVLAGVLFVQHLHTHDDGVTFKASMEAGRTKAKETNNAYRASFGVKSGDGIVRATIGKGKSPAHDNLNRDIDSVIEFDYNLNLKTIHLYFKGRDEAAEARAADRVNNAWNEMFGAPDDSQWKAQEESYKEDGTPNIKFFARAVTHTGGIYHHGYTVFTFSDGKQIIVSGFPEEGNMLKGNLKGVLVDYTKENLDKGLFLEKDWKGSKRVLVQQWKFPDDTSLRNSLAKAERAIHFVETGNNGGRFDYDICLTDSCPGANSNTVQRRVFEELGLTLEIPEELNLAGIRGAFFNGPLDSIKSFRNGLQQEQA